MHIALFGGSFNPPHVAHQMVCLHLLSTTSVERVWMVPCFQHPFAKQLASFADRFAMCELAAVLFGGRVEVSRVEAELGGASRTLYTVRHLRRAHPEHRFSLVLGTDILPELAQWHGWAEIQELCEVMVIGRSGYSAAGVDFFLPEISSTEIRARLAGGDEPTSWLPREVLVYVREHGLYRDRPGCEVRGRGREGAR
jgi:nicotinate-nucleotide adenylyltransferase